MNKQKATFAGGCFWCIESAFSKVTGVNVALSGYMDGEGEEPSYKAVCSGTTGFAEVVQVEYDADVLSYELLLKMFFTLHDPTQLNRQGNDVGTQYRSAIYYHDQAQLELATRFIQGLEEQAVFTADIVTEVTQVCIFYPAEDYHQAYYDNNSEQGYCQYVISPKLDKFSKHFAEYLKF